VNLKLKPGETEINDIISSEEGWVLLTIFLTEVLSSGFGRDHGHLKIALGKHGQ
jgi:hypothetical protein